MTLNELRLATSVLSPDPDNRNDGGAFEAFWDKEIVVNSPKGEQLLTIEAVSLDPITGLLVIETSPR